jgi:hypothetical protein
MRTRLLQWLIVNGYCGLGILKSVHCMKVSGGHLPGLFDAAGELLAIHSGVCGDQP